MTVSSCGISSSSSEDSIDSAVSLCYFNERCDIDTDMIEYQKDIRYSERYKTINYEYRHVILPKAYFNDYVTSRFKNRLLREDEWRYIGICQSPGWMHYMIHEPEPHIFLFKRELNPPTDHTAQIIKKPRISEKKVNTLKKSSAKPKRRRSARLSSQRNSKKQA
jgi:cyclin-dependent kinase regulatory subunit CKS1